MRSKLLFMLALLACWASTPAKAEFFSVGLDVPISHSFTNSDIESDGVSGFGLQIKFPLMVGVGLEQYDTKIKDSSGSTLATNLYDIFFQLPIPVINITFGGGLGTTDFKCSACGADPFKQANTSTAFLQVGWAILPFFDLHVGMHNTYAKLEPVGGGEKVDVGGKVTSVGLSFGF